MTDKEQILSGRKFVPRRIPRRLGNSFSGQISVSECFDRVSPSTEQPIGCEVPCERSRHNTTQSATARQSAIPLNDGKTSCYQPRPVQFRLNERAVPQVSLCWRPGRGRCVAPAQCNRSLPGGVTLTFGTIPHFPQGLSSSLCLSPEPRVSCRNFRLSDSVALSTKLITFAG